MTRVRKPVLALTIGDPAGIGPEIALQAAAMAEVRDLCRLILVGDYSVVENIRAASRVQDAILAFPADQLGGVLQVEPRGDVVELLDCRVLREAVQLGLPGEAGGAASYQYLRVAIALAKDRVLEGVVTAPINKLAWSLAGIRHPGHTELFAEETQADPTAMLMYSARLAVGLVTCHQSLASVSGSLTAQRIVATGELLSEAVGRIRGTKTRIAVMGLNPHAGESGLFGLEETHVIGPAVQQLRYLGIDAEGPYPPDTAFTPRMIAQHGAFLCMYHDQGLIPFKMVSFDDGVNVTMGLPFVRTSVDHGTAYDLAGRGTASVTSLIAAIQLAAKLVKS